MCLSALCVRANKRVGGRERIMHNLAYMCLYCIRVGVVSFKRGKGEERERDRERTVHKLAYTQHV